MLTVALVNLFLSEVKFLTYGLVIDLRDQPQSIPRVFIMFMSLVTVPKSVRRCDFFAFTITTPN